MTVEHDHLEQRLRFAFAEQPSVVGAAALDARVRAAMVARRVATPGGSRPRRLSWAMPAAAVAVLAVAGGVVWLSPRLASTDPVASAPSAVLVGSPSPSVGPRTPRPRRTQAPSSVIVPVLPHVDPVPSMDPSAVVAQLEDADQWWWSPGRRLGRFGRTHERPDGAVALGAYPPSAAVLVDPRPDGIVRISSGSDAEGEPDPYGCEPRSSGRYRIAATRLRLDVEPIADACAGRAAALAGTWQAVLDWSTGSVLVPFNLNPQVEAIRIDLTAAGAGEPPSFSLTSDGRDSNELGANATRGVVIRRPDATVRVGFPVRPQADRCVLDPDPSADVPILSAEDALADLRARPGITVASTTDLPVGDLAMTRADIAVTEDPGGCATAVLFAMAPKVQFDDEPLWPVPAPIAGDATAPVYLATVPGRDGETTAVAIVVEPLVDGVDRDAIAAQALAAIDWEPGLHPPAWPGTD